MRENGVGFIGPGDIASIHRAALLRVPGVEIVAVYDLDDARSKHLAADTGAKVCGAPKNLSTRARWTSFMSLRLSVFITKVRILLCERKSIRSLRSPCLSPENRLLK